MNYDKYFTNPGNYPFIGARSRSFVDNDAGLQGVDRELTKVLLDVARSLSRCRRAAKIDGGKFPRLISSRTAIHEKMVDRYVALGDAYFPDDSEKLPFRMKLLCGMGLDRLEAFLPHLSEMYSDRNSPLRQTVYLTELSIEALCGGASGGKWIDLRRLDVASIRDLPQTVGIVSWKDHDFCDPLQYDNSLDDLEL